ncbi:MAG TPA: LLM class flavin-dependent oxidoreductase [Xanthobacteraceae bacterium]|nr:LLM class flavin-dependent oxidoreductase [Xanthobacteraceae bacterium]
MSVEFIGYIGTRPASEIHPPQGPVVDRAYIERNARAHEASGFDRALVAFHSTSPESILIAGHAASVTQRLGLMIAHRPGFTAPTLAARQLATLDQLTGGRVAVHIITGGDDAEQRQDGDFLGKDERYARTDEYLEVVRKVWTSDKPFDHQGRFYRFERAFSAVKSVRPPHIPIYFGGASDAAIAVAGKHADIYALWGETYAQVRELTARVRAAAAAHGRQLRFSLSLRPILADTEQAAWERAEDILARAKALQEQTGYKREAPPVNVGSLRLIEAARQGARVDKRLWTAIAALTGAKGNSTALVGTPEQVADALLDYYDLGITTFLIRGFDPLEDAIDYGRKLIPLTRALVAERARAAATAAE